MSAVSPVSTQFSSAMTFSTGAIGGVGTDATAAPSGVGSPTGALGLQTSLMLQQGNGPSNVDQLAALALMLLLSKSNDSQKSDENAWQMLAALALMSGMSGNGQTTFSFSQSVGEAAAVYAGGGAAAAPSVNLQG